jgi:hypothetical protein
MDDIGEDMNGRHQRKKVESERGDSINGIPRGVNPDWLVNADGITCRSRLKMLVVHKLPKIAAFGKPMDLWAH